ncbi:hypothetical protein DOL97_02070 [Salmonella enterica subsp. enterica serovar Derby]|nr:hypothetical protein DOL97_02070 [Salmonella enterica subsp. enterica serovar Derby]
MHKNIQMFSKKDYAASLLKGSIILYPQSGFGHELKGRNRLKKNKINMNNVKTHIYLNDDEIKLKTT